MYFFSHQENALFNQKNILGNNYVVARTCVKISHVHPNTPTGPPTPTTKATRGKKMAAWGLKKKKPWILPRNITYYWLVGGWTNQPIWKICDRQIGSFPQLGDEHKNANGSVKHLLYPPPPPKFQQFDPEKLFGNPNRKVACLPSIHFFRGFCCWTSGWFLWSLEYSIYSYSFWPVSFKKRSLAYPFLSTAKRRHPCNMAMKSTFWRLFQK